MIIGDGDAMVMVVMIIGDGDNLDIVIFYETM